MKLPEKIKYTLLLIFGLFFITTSVLVTTCNLDVKDAYADGGSIKCISTGTQIGTKLKGQEQKTWQEGIFVDNENNWLYCVALQHTFSGGSTTGSDATSFMSQSSITKIALAQNWIFNVQKELGGSEQKYYMLQQYIWIVLSDEQGYASSLDWVTGPKGGSGDVVNIKGGDAAYASWWNTVWWPNLTSYISNNENGAVGNGKVYRGAGQELAGYFNIEFFGTVAVQKKSTLPKISEDNPCYNLSGAEYTIYSDSKCTQSVAKLTTDASGYGKVDNIKAGKYWVKETKLPSLGYIWDSEIHEVNVECGATASFASSEPPACDSLPIKIAKYDSDFKDSFSIKNGNNPQGGSMLAGAEFTVSFYWGHYKTEDEAKKSGNIKKKWVYKTDSEGYIDTQNSAYLKSGDPYKDASGKIVFPLGTYVIAESKAPEGYLINTKKKLVRIVLNKETCKIERHGDVENDTITQSSDSQFASFNNDVIRGGIKIEKRDLESKLKTPLGGATLDGTTFDIININSNSVVVDGKSFESGSVVIRLEIKDGEASTEANCLPFGEYEIQEVKSSQGYLITDSNPRTFKITEANKIISPFCNSESFFNQVIRGDLEFIKADGQSGQRLANIPFRITSQTTGESHILVTDKNGYANTHSSWNSHENYTNKNDESLTSDGEIDEEKLNSEYGIWFGVTDEGNTVSADDSLGALIYDTYKIEELPCTTNAGYELVTIDNVSITRANYTINLGTIDNNKIPEEAIEIETKVRNADNWTQLVKGYGTSNIVDQVSLKNLEVGKSYTLKGTLIDKGTGEVLTKVNTENEKVPYTSTVEFDLQETGSVSRVANTIKDVPFVVQGCDVAGKEIVIYEELYTSETNTTLASHQNLDNIDQTFKASEIEIKTTAFSGEDGQRIIVADKTSVVVDEVSITGLTIGKTYSLHASVVDPANKTPYKNSEGKSSENSVSFSANSESAVVRVPIEVNTSEAYEKKLVVFEELYEGEELIAEHKDENDENQTCDIKKEQESPKEVPEIKEEPKSEVESKSSSMPQTGDDFMLVSFFIFVCMSCLSITILIAYNKRKE